MCIRDSTNSDVDASNIDAAEENIATLATVLESAQEMNHSSHGTALHADFLIDSLLMKIYLVFMLSL